MITITELPVAGRGVVQRKKLFTELYETAFPMVARFVSNRRGSLQDAKDIFQDALVIFYEKLSHKRVEIEVPDEAYVLGIAKHLWMRKYKNDSKNIFLDELESTITLPDDYFQTPGYSEKLISNFLMTAGKRCMELLTAFYYHNYSMKEITRVFGYGSERSATVQKFKCLEKVRDVVKEKSLDYESFTE